MLIRDVKLSDKKTYLAMAQDFYSGEATLFSLPLSHFEDTFEMGLSASPMMRLLVLAEQKEAQEEVVGYAHLAFTWTCEAGGKVCWLEEIYLLPGQRGQGYGKAFITWLLDTYKDTCRRFRLEVCPHNEKARSLYESLGFTELPYQQLVKDQ